MEIVGLDDARFQFRSDFVATEMSGEAAAEFVNRALIDLTEPRSFDEIAASMPDYRPESLRGQLDALVAEGVLVVGADTSGAPLPANRPFHHLLDEMGLDAAATMQRLATQTVAVFGLEAHGAHVAAMLADAGVGTLVLVDPYTFEDAHRYLTPVSDPAAVGMSRQDAVAGHVRRDALSVESPARGDAVDKAAVSAAVESCDLAIVCWDRGMSAAGHWANEAAIASETPALFSELRATSCIAGPFVFPSRSACLMCYRMRALACEKDFELSMAYEEHLTSQRRPSLADRPMLPIVPTYLSSILGLEALRYLIRLNQPRLVDRVLEFDGLQAEARLHPVLVQPACPVCGKKKRRIHPSRAQLRLEERHSASVDDVADNLVSKRTGIVSEFQAASRDATEPHQPLVWRAKLANHAFATEPDDSHLYCSGKGFSTGAAWMSCLGEAAERYSGGRWRWDELTVATRSRLTGPSIDPRDLVLYRPEDYAALPYAPYEDATELTWIEGHSLVHDRVVWVPAIAALMEFTIPSEAEFLFPITSNGLAAGPTLRDAVVSAIYEVLERDAFLINWHNRLPARVLDAATHSDPAVREIAAAYRRRRVRLKLFLLPTDHPVSVVMAVAFQDGGFGGPAATVGLGAHLRPDAAARQAVLEVGQVRPAFRERVRSRDAPRVAELAEDPDRVVTMEDHSLLYADPAMLGAFDFLDGEDVAWDDVTDNAAHGDDVALDALIDHFSSVGQEVAYVNLTSPDVEPLGLFTARAVLPGFQPIWFGHHERRLAGRRLFELPHRLGLQAAPSDMTTINPLPHPLA